MNYTPPQARKYPDYSSDDYWRIMLRLQAFRDNRSRTKLRRIGIDLSCIEVFSTINILPPAGSKVPWSPSDATTVMSSWRPRLKEFDVTVLCGRRAAEAFSRRLFGRMEDSCGRLKIIDGLRVMMIPHPSGLNLWWNDDLQVRELKERVEECLELV